MAERLQKHRFDFSGRLDDLKSSLLKVLSGSITEQDLTELVQFSRVLIESHLRCMRPSMDMLCRNQGLTFTELAYDCIAEAFARDRDGRFRHLLSFVAVLRCPLDEIQPHELFLAYRGFLVKLADSQLARLFALSDPVGAKIHRNIRDCVKTGRHFSLRKDFRGLVLVPRSGNSHEERPLFPVDELWRQLAESAAGCGVIPELLGALHRVLLAQDMYRRTIPLRDVVQLFKLAYRGDGEEDAAVTANRSDLEGLSDFEIERLRLQVESALKEKIALTYLLKGKMDRDEAEAIFGAFHDMLCDWCSPDGEELSLAAYLARHAVLDEGEYERRYRIKMEYLLKLIRQEFASRLLREI